LFVERQEGQSLEDALANSNFSEIHTVLNAMQEQDDNFVQIVREMTEANGRGDPTTSAALDEKLEMIGPTVDLSVLRTSISVEIVNALGLRWDEWYGRLQAIKRRHGRAFFSKIGTEDPRLLQWYLNQIRLAKTEDLSPEKIAKLDIIASLKEFNKKENLDIKITQLVPPKIKKILSNRELIEKTKFKLTESILSRIGVFSAGVVSTPLEKVYRIFLNETNFDSNKSYKIRGQDLKSALDQAGWIHAGRIGSMNFPGKRNIYYCPTLRNLTKSQLRDLLEVTKLRQSGLSFNDSKSDTFGDSNTENINESYINIEGTKENQNFTVDENVEALIDRVKNKSGIFAFGVLVTPLEKFCLIAAREMSVPKGQRVQISSGALTFALNKAGWIDHGRIASAQNPSKRHVFCAPDFKNLSKSRIRNLVAEINLEEYDLGEETVIGVSDPVAAKVNPAHLDGYAVLVSLIISRHQLFAGGIAVSPFMELINALNELPELEVFPNFIITRTNLEAALLDSDWIDLGRIASQKYPSKRRIFRSPHLKHLNKSQLRDLVEEISDEPE
jgi:hypothetical protein